jgi:ribosomal 30S subunit maturation factor RimM
MPFGIAGAKRVNAATDKPKSVEYYKKLYSYAPEYLKLVMKEISEMSSL